LMRALQEPLNLSSCTLAQMISHLNQNSTPVGVELAL
jgi:hypothetical protein